MAAKEKSKNDEVVLTSVVEQKPAVQRRNGFLPIYTNAFDRVFISIVLYVAIGMLWMRLAEPPPSTGEPMGPTAWIPLVYSIVQGYVIIRWG